MDTDILIVGAGPTGLMLANQLGRRGVRSIIIDRHCGPAQQTRAMAVHARTLEIYAQLGIAEAAIARGKRGYGANLWAAAEHKARIPFEEMGTGLSAFPYVLMLGQDENELILGDKLREWDLEVQWNTELVSLEQHADHAVATLRLPDGGARRLTAAWVAGCDGSRSFVREHSGITFPGAAYEHSFFVADTVATGAMVPGELNVYLWQEGFHLFFPMRGRDCWRVIGILPPGLDQDNVTFEQVVPDIRKAAGAKLQFPECRWFSTYRIQHRAAARFRADRCFVLGDAAHIHSPMGGQGMNTGLQDVYNLAWKLALVVKGEADEALLDSYESERRPVAQKLLDTTDRMFTTVVSDGWLAKLFRTQVVGRVAAFAMRRERVRQVAFRTISQIGIEYRDSPLSKTLSGIATAAPQAGDRFPWLQLQLADGHDAEDLFARLDDRRFNLIVAGQSLTDNEAQTLGELALVHAIPATAANDQALAAVKISGPCFYVLRPDGHVGLAGTRLDRGAILRYFADSHIRTAAFDTVALDTEGLSGATNARRSAAA